MVDSGEQISPLAPIADVVVDEVLRARCVPQATYRVQLHRDMTLYDAAGIAPYLQSLGISHVYTSPYMRSRAVSGHGYDVCDHNQIDPNLGGDEGLRAFSESLQTYSLGHILDVVPNHMAAGHENPWWRDVLENGPNSPYSGFFDIDWHPVKDELENHVLTPILGAQYGDVLESGQLQIEHADGGFDIKYFDRTLPLGPKTTMPVLTHRLDELRDKLGEDSPSFLEFQSIVTALEHLPPATATNLKAVNERRREKEIIKKRLRELEASEPQIAELIAANVELFNGRVGDPASFDRLDKLLQSQSYRLCHWRSASDEINYRRFFDVNDLTALSIERPEVYYVVSQLLGRLLGEGRINGLRIDHIDGLFAPEEYLWRLQWTYLAQVARIAFNRRVQPSTDSLGLEYQQIAEESSAAPGEGGVATVADPPRTRATTAYLGPQILNEVCRRLHLRLPRKADIAAVFGAAVAEAEDYDHPSTVDEMIGSDAVTDGPSIDPANAPLLVLVEKILSPEEPLPTSWPVAGTTGYDFGNLLNGAFIEPAGWSEICKHYTRFTGETRSFAEIVRDCKQLILRFSMASELQMLAHRLNRISEQHRKTRDFTLNALRYALREVLVSFPVYRAYPSADGVSQRDQQIVQRAVALAKRRNRATDPATFDFIRDILLLRHPPGLSQSAVRSREEFAARFQQVTSPVMAKGVEDTAFYVYMPLASVNEVGGDPTRAVVDLQNFHAHNQQRCEHQRRGLLATTTHDTKRSEDVRARLDVLSEIPQLWRTTVNKWTRLTRRFRIDVEGAPAPCVQDEYLFYQSLLGIWPSGDVDGASLEEISGRLQAYMEKATREAKLRTSWINPHAEYDQAVRQFVGQCLTPDKTNRFLSHFTAFFRRVSAAGYYTALSQLVLKLMSPGVPDIYQGQEFWDFSLVDPDNRRAVDYTRRRALLEEIRSSWMANAEPGRRADFVADLIRRPHDDRLKMFVTWRLLDVRRRLAGLFATGRYVPATVTGSRADHVIAFHWHPSHDDCSFDGEPRRRASLLVAAPRFWFKLCESSGCKNPAAAVADPETCWGDTALALPEAALGTFHNVFTDERVEPGDNIRLSRMLRRFPVAVLADDSERPS